MRTLGRGDLDRPGPLALMWATIELLPICSAFARADARIRTGDPFITSEVLYQLSYVGGRDESSDGSRRPLAAQSPTP